MVRTTLNMCKHGKGKPRPDLKRSMGLGSRRSETAVEIAIWPEIVRNRAAQHHQIKNPGSVPLPWVKT